jgi:hypothetical protein
MTADRAWTASPGGLGVRFLARGWRGQAIGVFQSRHIHEGTKHTVGDSEAANGLDAGGENFRRRGLRRSCEVMASVEGPLRGTGTQCQDLPCMRCAGRWRGAGGPGGGIPLPEGMASVLGLPAGACEPSVWHWLM